MHHRRTHILLTLVLGVSIAVAGALAAVAAASGSSTKLTTEKVKPGKVIATSSGQSVYLFSLDSASKSACSGSCASAWPPITGSATVAGKSGLNPKLLGTVKRSDGRSQVTYNGHPLYLFSGDKKSHAIKGEGAKAFGGHWYLVGPRGGAVKPKKKKYCQTVCQGY